MTALTIVNQKGGVGKTTTVLGLAAAASRRGLDVVVVDLDPQANATTGLGVWAPERTVDEALADERPGSAAELVVSSGWDSAVLGRSPRLVPSSPALAGREPVLATDPLGAQDRLRLALRGVEADLVLIDCPPSLGLLTVNGLFAADGVVVVTEPAAWATDGVAQILHNVARIAERRGGSPRVAGIVVNRVPRTRDGRYWDAQLVESHPDLVVRPGVAHRAAVAEAAAQSLPIHALERSGVAEAVAELDAVLDALLAAMAEPEAPRPEPAGDAHGHL